jgi:lipooligosaccharide transport system permease protein
VTEHKPSANHGTPSRWALPRPSLRCIPVWRRNLLVWRKLAIPSLLGNFADPLIMMLGLGYGLGALIPEVDGVRYASWLAAGTVCFSTMNSATFEALYSAFSRMQVQRTWDAILNAPITLDDVVLAELLWAASKSLLSGLAILLVVLALGLVQSPLQSPQLLWLLLVIPLIGLCFAALALMITALARSYDFFMYYFTLVITPMSMLSGVFFPVSQLPQALQSLALLMPMYHATQLVRPLMLAEWPQQGLLHVTVLLGCAVFGLYGASVLFRRRLAR